MGKRKDHSVLLGERDGDGRLKMPHTCYGLFGNVAYMLQRILTIGPVIVTLVVSSVTVIVLDFRLILILSVVMLLNYLSSQWSIRQDKVQYWDKVSPIYRKRHYIERCTQDFAVQRISVCFP